VNNAGPPEDTPNDVAARAAAASCPVVADTVPADLVVSGGGATVVDTETLFAQRELMRRLQVEARGWQQLLERIRSLAPTGAPTWQLGDSDFALLAVARSVDGIEKCAEELAHKLTVAAESYAQAERFQAEFDRVAGELSGWLLGAGLRLFGPVLLVQGLQLAALAALGIAVDAAVTKTSQAEVTASLLSRAGNSQLLTNSALVTVLRAVMSSVDDLAAGFVGVPFPVSGLLGEGGLGALGVTSSAAVALAVARGFDRLSDTPVVVSRQGSVSRVDAPTSIEALAARIPPAEEGRPQVRIEQYGDVGHPAWAVYIAGTVDWNPVGSTEPWDLSSNVAAMAGESAGSYQAVVQAMQAAGIADSDPVVLVGHSQGGLVAQQVAATGGFNSGLVITFGAPETPTTVPDGVTELSVEHTDDLVPALGGLSGVAGAAGIAADRIYVRRAAFSGAEVPTDTALPAHAMSAYRATARAVDASTEPALVAARARLITNVGADPGTVTAWRGLRTPRSRQKVSVVASSGAGSG